MAQQSNQLNIGIKKLPGVGNLRAVEFAKLGVTDFDTLLHYYPRAYEYRGNVKTLIAGQDGEKASFILTIAAYGTSSRVKNNMTVTKFLAYDETAKCTITFFNQIHMRESMRLGSIYRCYGKLVKFGRQFEIVNPICELVENVKGEKNTELLSLFPIYAATKNLSSLQVFKTVRKTFEYIEESGGAELLGESLPKDIVEKYGFMSQLEAIKTIHMPSDFRSLNEAKRRLAYEEMYFFAQKAVNGRKKNDKEIALYIPRCDMKEFVAELPYELTSAQKKAINEIYADMVGRGKPPMRRMLSGDVGSGKTVCAAAAAYICIKGGYQAALMAPTDILARQHHKDISKLFEPLGIRTVLLTGSCTKSERERAYRMISDGSANMIIGTHALIADNVSFASLALVICDEQHRFGVNQRRALMEKGNGVDLLAMSATPIPRTLALVMFGDLDVSILDELPPGRKEVGTFVVGESYRNRMYEFIRSEVEEGHQVYIVCPSVDDLEENEYPIEALKNEQSVDNYKNEKEKRLAAVSYAQHLVENVFPEYRVAYLHGKMHSVQKNAIMESFSRGRIDILVATTVIEVGVNVPNATVMVIENADCFGLSQLHQLRGRVGRGENQSYCILVSSSRSEATMKRLNVMKECRDGYKIAESDLKFRGPGDFIKENSEKIRQHGDIKTSFGSMLDDVELLYSAFADAKANADNGSEEKTEEK